MTDRPAGFTVAVVDDDRRMLESLESLLGSAGHPVRLFTSAAALLESGSLGEIHCLISDIDMPGMNGVELLRRVHAARPGLPTILITGFPDALKRLPFSVGSNPRVFNKPFVGRRLLEAVANALQGSTN